MKVRDIQNSNTYSIEVINTEIKFDQVTVYVHVIIFVAKWGDFCIFMLTRTSRINVGFKTKYSWVGG